MGPRPTSTIEFTPKTHKIKKVSFGEPYNFSTRCYSGITEYQKMYISYKTTLFMKNVSFQSRLIIYSITYSLTFQD